MNGSLKQRFGDNIYHHDVNGAWMQADSRHSNVGQSNDFNLRRDTGLTDRVLVGSNFVYWGEAALEIPRLLQRVVIARPGWGEFPDDDAFALAEWAKGMGQQGLVSDPLEWRYERWWR